MSGGGGYLLSRGALKLLIEKGLNKSDSCLKEDGTEDVRIGSCLEAIGVKVKDNRDKGSKERFDPLPALTILTKSLMKSVPWMYSYNYHPLRTGNDCCSDETVTFHYISPHEMYLLEFLVYHLKPYGIIPYYNEMKGFYINQK